MAEHPYPLIVQPISSEDGGGFFAVAPDLPGCAGDGDTPAAAIADLLSAIDEWTDEAQRLGRDVPLPGSGVAAVQRQWATLETLIARQDELIKAQDNKIATQRAEIEELRESVDPLLEHRALGLVTVWSGQSTGMVSNIAHVLKLRRARSLSS